MKFKVTKVGLAIATLILVIVGLSYLMRQPNSSSGKISVVASFYPMAEFARQVGGGHVVVKTLVPAGTEPHDFDPSPRDLAGVHKAQVFIYNGANFEPWAGKITAELKHAGTSVVNASQNLELIAKGASEEEEASHSAAGLGQSYDPHVWLDPVLAARQVDNIKAGLVAADPSHASDYEANATRYKQQLSALDEDYRHSLSGCSHHNIIMAHQASSYLARRYKLNVLAIAGLSPNEEPSPRKLAEITRFARQHELSYIFFETLASPKLTETIAREVGARTLVFSPLEGLTSQEQAAGKDYISVQKANIENLKIALDCK